MRITLMHDNGKALTYEKVLSEILQYERIMQAQRRASRSRRRIHQETMQRMLQCSNEAQHAMIMRAFADSHVFDNETRYAA